jgi:hypothetical protein
MNVSNDRNRINRVFKEKVCPVCSCDIKETPKSIFKLAPCPEMITVNCVNCGSDFRVSRHILDELGINYNIRSETNKDR